MFKKISIIAAIVFSIILISYFAVLWGGETPGSFGADGDATGIVYDKDASTTDNFMNGKVLINVKIIHVYLDDILDNDEPMVISMRIGKHVGDPDAWYLPEINLRENSGKTEANYGENIECDGVVSGPEDRNDNLYIKIFVPTNSRGRVVVGDEILIEMWPTTDPIDQVDNMLTPASFDNAASDDWWNENYIVALFFGGKKSLYLGGFSGAFLVGSEIDE